MGVFGFNWQPKPKSGEMGILRSVRTAVEILLGEDKYESAFSYDYSILGKRGLISISIMPQSSRVQGSR